MTEAAVFMTNRSQAIRLPADVRFDEHVKKVTVRVVGCERILAPVENTWDSFFLSADSVSDDFMNERDNHSQPDREAF